MNWNLMEHLAKEAGCRRSFKLAIAGYLSAVYQYMRQHSTAVPVQRADSQASQAPPPAATLGVAAHANLAEFAQKLISEEMSQKLFEITERINRKLPRQPVAPLAGGIPGTTIRPALEFIKAICHVLGLDPAIEDTVYSLKRNMLRLIAVGEFSEIAEWKDPSISYVLPGYICKSCNHCRDIDLGRDNHQNIEENSRTWYCPLCKADYDNKEIENLLLDIISRKMLAYNLQDLQCKKCGQIKMENLTSYCSCAGDFKCIISQTDLIKLLNIFHKIATAFHMSTLLETIDSIFIYLN